LAVATFPGSVQDMYICMLFNSASIRAVNCSKPAPQRTAQLGETNDSETRTCTVALLFNDVASMGNWLPGLHLQCYNMSLSCSRVAVFSVQLPMALRKTVLNYSCIKQGCTVKAQDRKR
jgi:hypothetical protein